MGKRKKISGILAWIVFFAITVQGHSQTKYSLSTAGEMKVSGTSTLHDWDMNAEGGVSGSASMTLEGGKLKDISALKVELKAESLKSGTKSMDTNAYKALDTNRYPTITFELVGPINVIGNKITSNGKLTISGTSNTIPFEVSYAVSGSNVSFSGTKAIKFTDYKIEPPKAVFGTIKTGDELMLAFDITFKQTP